MLATPRQKRFVLEYLLDSNATQAAIRAGYSKQTADVQASRLLRNVKVQAAVKQKQIETEERLKFRRENVLKELVQAVQVAKDQGEPKVMISALKQIALMQGYYSNPPIIHTGRELSVAELQELPESTLVEMVGSVEYVSKVESGLVNWPGVDT